MPSAVLQNTTISSDTTTGPIKVRRGGAHRLDAIRTAGSIDLSLEISLDGSTYVPARDTTGALIEDTVDATTEHWAAEFLCQVDCYLQIVSTNNSSGNVQVALTRVVAE